MSQLQTAYLKRTVVPDLITLQSAIDALGFKLKIDSFYVPFQAKGFLPCKLNGKDSGFEIYFESTANVVNDFPHLAKEIADRDAAISFRWGGDMSECACVLIVSAALAKSFDAIIHYQDDDILYKTDQLINEAKLAVKMAK